MLHEDACKVRLARDGQSPTTFVNYYRVRIDPRRSETTDQVIAFDFGEKGKAGLHIRRGVVEFLSGPAKHYHQPDVVVSLNGESWAKLHLNQSGLASLVETSEAKLTKGDIETAAALLELFDALEP